MGQRSKRLWLAFVLAVGWCGAALPARAVGNEPGLDFTGALAAPRRLEERVRLWIDVFTRWSVEQAIVQDRDRPWEVFAVVPIDRPSREELGRVRAEYEDLARRTHRALEDPAAPGSAAIVGEGGLAWRRLLPPVRPAALAEARDRIEVRPGQREIFRDSLDRSRPFLGAIKRMVTEAGLPEEIAYLPHVESSFNADARSNVGAVGIWQLMPETARRTLRVDGGRDERRDPVRSTLAAMHYFREAHERLGSWPLAVTSYNYGVNGMRRAIEALGTSDLVELIDRHDSPAFGYSAKNFFAQFLAAVHIARHEDFYFPPRSRTRPRAAAAPQATASPARCGPPQAPTLLLASAPDPGIRFSFPERRTPIATAALPQAARLEDPPAAAASITSASVAARRATFRGAAAPTGGPATRPRPTASEPARGDGLARREHVVRKGDSLWTIARQHGTTVAAIRSANRAVSPSARLQLGQRLVIEG